MLSSSLIALICAAVFLASAMVLGVMKKSLSRLSISFFVMAFVSGTLVLLFGGIQPRSEQGGIIGAPMGGMPMGEAPPENSPPPGGMGGSIGKIDPQELAALQKRVAGDPNDVKARERLGHLFLQQQDYDGVFKMAHEALQKDPNSAESRAHMGMVFFAMQQFDESLDQFNRALQSSPKNLEALLFKGIVQFQGQHDLKGARETWQQYMKYATPKDDGWNRVQMFLQMIESQLPKP